MKKFTMTYDVWSFYWMQNIQFVLTVEARDLREAEEKVRHHNRLAENIKPA